MDVLNSELCILVSMLVCLFI